MRVKKPVKITHKAPKKKGKVEVRNFKDVKEALAYIERNVGKRLKP